MSVLFIGTLPEPVTGQSLACQVLLDELVREQPVQVLNLSKDGFRQGVSSFGRVVEIARLLKQVWRRRNDCDVIYLTIAESLAGNLRDLFVYGLCFRRLRRLAIHLHGGAGLRLILQRRRSVMGRLNAFFLKRLGAVIVLGERHVSMFDGLVDRRRIHLVPNFAEDSLFVEAADVERNFEDARPLRILFLSNLLPGKGYLELAQAFLSLDAQAQAAVQVDFAGGFESAKHEREFLALIEGHPQLKYHGSVRGARKRELFAGAHVFCLPTYYPYEGQPISILEAYASGCAVITTDHSGILDTFTDGINGYQVATRSADAVKAAILKALGAPAELRAIALANLRLARERYRTTRYTSDLVGILSGLQQEAR